MLYIKADHLADGIYNIKDGEIFKYKAKGGTVRTYEIGNIVRCKECKYYKQKTDVHTEKERVSDDSQTDIQDAETEIL